MLIMRKWIQVFAVTSSLATMFIFTNQPAYASGTLTIAQTRDPQSLDPVDTFTLAWGSFGSNIFDGLVVRDENLVLKPALAERWEFLENNKRIRFYLRSDVAFHNGEPFNAAAVKFTFERLLGEQGKKGPQRSNYTAIDHLEIVDEYTVDFVMGRVDPVFITKLAGYGAMIVPPRYISEVGEEAFDKKPVGTGPFQVVNYTPLINLELKKFNNYWNGKAKVDALNIRFIAEPSTRIAELLSGGVDIVLTVPISAVGTIQAHKDAELVAVDGPTIQMLRLNTANGITSDIRVRKALNMAIDKASIIRAMLKGYGKPISTPQGAKSFGFDENLGAYPYDVAQAKRLLQEAGVKSGTEITLDMPNNSDTWREVAQAVSGLLSLIDLKVKIRMHEQNVYATDIIPNGKTGELFTFGWGGWTFDFDNTAYLLYHSGERWNPYMNIPELDAMLKRQREIYDPQVREEILKQIGAYVHEYALDVPLYNESKLYGVGKHVKGFVPAPDDRTRFMSVSLDK